MQLCPVQKLAVATRLNSAASGAEIGFNLCEQPAKGLGSVKSCAHARGTLRTTTTKSLLAADRQLAGARIAGLGRSGNTEELGDLDTAALRTMGNRVGTADQGLESMVARLAVILVDRHGRRVPPVWGSPKALLSTEVDGLQTEGA
jgi:hypothetical protein